MQETMIDGYAVAIRDLITDSQTIQRGPLYHCRDLCLHAKRCMVWVLLKHTIHEAKSTYKAQADHAEGNAKKKASKREAEAMDSGDEREESRKKGLERRV